MPKVSRAHLPTSMASCTISSVWSPGCQPQVTQSSWALGSHHVSALDLSLELLLPGAGGHRACVDHGGRRFLGGLGGARISHCVLLRWTWISRHGVWEKETEAAWAGWTGCAGRDAWTSASGLTSSSRKPLRRQRNVTTEPVQPVYYTKGRRRTWEVGDGDNSIRRGRYGGCQEHQKTERFRSEVLCLCRRNFIYQNNAALVGASSNSAWGQARTGAQGGRPPGNGAALAAGKWIHHCRVALAGAMPWSWQWWGCLAVLA